MDERSPEDPGPPPQVSGRLLESVYRELRRLAEVRIAQAGGAASLVPTELVHEAFLKLERSDADWDGPSHYFAAAAEAMRRILVDRARERGALKRGGRRPQPLTEEPAAGNGTEEAPDDLLELDAALAALAALEERDARLALLAKLRYFAGLTHEQAAAAMDVSPRTARRDWATARAWLRVRMEEGVERHSE